MSFEALTRMAAVGAAGTVIALGAAAPAEAAPQPSTPYYMTHDDPRSGLELQTPPHNTFGYTPIVYQETPKTTEVLPWAETFVAQDVSPSNVSGVIALLNSVEQSPLVKVVSIDVEGISSDEASIDEPNAGLGIADPQDVTLAKGRAENAATTISDELTKDGKNIPVVVTGGKENVLPQAEVERLQALAANDGITLSKAVSRFDYGYGAADISAALTKDLADQRGVEVTVVAQVAVPVFGMRAREREDTAPQEDAPVTHNAPENSQHVEHTGQHSGVFNTLRGKFGGVVTGLGILAAGLRRNNTPTPSQPQPERVPAEQSDADERNDRELIGVL